MLTPADPLFIPTIEAEFLNAADVTPEQIEALKALPAYRKLRWIIYNERHTTYRALSRALKATEAAVGRWLHDMSNRRHSPESYTRRQIEAWTEGSIIGPIRPVEWATKKEREADALVPRWEPDVRSERAA